MQPRGANCVVAFALPPDRGQRMCNRRLRHHIYEQLHKGYSPIELLKNMDKWTRPGEFWCVVSYLKHQRRMDDALEAFEWWRMQPMYRAREKHFVRFMSMAGKLEMPDAAQQVFDTMQQQHNVPPSIASYTVLIHSYAEAGNFDRAHQLLEEMISAGLTPDVVTYDGLMHAYAKHQLYDEMIKVFSRMKSAKCVPDMSVYKTMIRAYSMAGLVAEMDGVFQAMLSDAWTPDSPCLDSMTRGYASLGMIKDMERMLIYYRKLHMTPSHECIRAVALAYIKQNQFYKMREFVKSRGMKNVSRGDMQWNLLLLAHAANFSMKSLQREVQNMAALGFKPNLTGFNIRAVAFSKMQMFWDLHVLVRHMQSLAVTPDLVTYGAVVDAYISARLHDKLCLALDQLQMLESTPRVATDTILFEAFGKGKFHLFCEEYMDAGSKLTYSALTTCYLEKISRQTVHRRSSLTDV